MLVRRSVAAILVFAAAVTVFFADQRAAPGTAVVAAVRATCGRGPLDRRRCHSDPVPAETVPDGALRLSADARGRTVTGAVRRHEVLTDTRLRAAAASTADGLPGARLVPVHLAERGTADLLVPGDVVDVLTKGGPDGTSGGRRVGRRRGAGHDRARFRNAATTGRRCCWRWVPRRRTGWRRPV